MNLLENLYEDRTEPVSAIARAATVDSIADTSLQSIIRRILECVELETKSIRADNQFDAKQSNSRKSRLLYELGRASRNMNLADLDRSCRDDLEALRAALSENETVLKAQISAVSEVASIVQNAIEREETDGTYTTGGMAAPGLV